LPLPNWHFWGIKDKYGNPFDFVFFDGYTPEQLVDNFKKAVRKNSISALILVDPANPMMYSLSEEQAKEIDRVAMDNGIDIIVDDVLRGVKPLGKRDSVARFFTRPYVVEGLSKRFGDKPLGECSYVIVPKDSSFSGRKCNCTDDDKKLMAMVVKNAIQYASEPAIEEYTRRNTAFDEGLREQAPTEVEVIRPYPSHIISLIEVPNKCNISAYNFAVACLKKGVLTSPIPGFFPDNFSVDEEHSRLLRITVGRAPADMIKIGAQIIGTELSYYFNH